VSAIAFDGVWKSYPRWSGGSRTLRGIVALRIPALVRGEQRWALRDVSLSVASGESVGIIGQNGAGKSTLLRLASGLARPSRGRLRLPDDMASVLSLGDSFDPSLTGRENAYTAAAVGGLRRAQIRAAMPAVLEFAELEAFADAPVRTFSDGMKLRLAFGVVAQLRPQALLLDEVIAVGDLRFQAKCMNRIREMRESGTSVLFASHSLEQVAEECDRAVWLDGGGVRAVGESGSIVEAYEDAMRSQTLELTPAPEGPEAAELELRRNRLGSQEVTIDRVLLHDPDGRAISEVAAGRSLGVALTVRNHGAPVQEPIVAVSVHRVSDGVVVYDTNTEIDGARIGRLEAGAQVSVVFERLDLVPGDYMVDVGVYEPSWAHAYDFHWQAYPLRVTGRPAGLGVVRAAARWRVGP